MVIRQCRLHLVTMAHSGCLLRLGGPGCPLIDRRMVSGILSGGLPCLRESAMAIRQCCLHLVTMAHSGLCI